MAWLTKNYIQSVMFYPPQPLMHYPAEEPVSGGTLIGEDEVLNVNPLARSLYAASGVPCFVVEHASPRLAVIYFHGNNENLFTMRGFLDDLSQALQATVYAFEYEGYFYDETGTKPSEQGCYINAEKFYAAVRSTTDLPVVLFGYSMGCAVALHTAQVHRNDTAPLVLALLAPFVSAASVELARSGGMLTLSPLWSPFDVFVMKYDAIHQGRPTFVAAGGNDKVIPAFHAEAIAAYAGRHGKMRYLFLPEATHANIRAYAEVYEDILDFLTLLQVGHA